MSRHNKLLYPFLFVLMLMSISFPNVTRAQQVQGLKEIIQIGLDNNLNIAITKIAKERATINTGKGAAGMLPSVNLDASGSYAINNANQVFLDGRENSIKGGTNLSLNGGVRMDWTIYDGKRMFARKDILDIENDIAHINYLNQQLVLKAQITELYELMVLQKRHIAILDQNIDYLSDFLELAKAKLDIGSGTKLDVLQANTDLNELTNNRDLMVLQYEVTQTELNTLLQRGAGEPIQVDTQFLVVNKNIDPAFWEENAQKNNLDLLSARKQNEITLKQVDLAKGGKLPQVNLNAGLNYGFLNSTTGFLVSNVAYGPYLGVTANYNLYDGKRVERENQIAQLNAIEAKLSTETLTKSIENELQTEQQNYNFKQALYNSELENLDMAKENFDLAKQLYTSGRITQFELRQVFLQQLSINQRLIQAEYDKIMAYVRLMQLSGQDWF